MRRAHDRALRGRLHRHAWERRRCRWVARLDAPRRRVRLPSAVRLATADRHRCTARRQHAPTARRRVRRGGPTDHTVGDRCKTDDECDKTGDGISRCSAGIFSEGSLYPTNVCLGLECDPGDGTSVSHCDGDKGICLATDGGGGGICLGICSFDTSSAAPKGCVGKDVCNEANFDHDATGALVGFGYCFGGCTDDSDCETSGERCQKERGLCVRRLATFTKKLGEACTSADVSKTPVACNCIYVAPTNKGYCSAFCEMGVSTCASGYTCDAFLPLLDPFTGGPGFSGKVATLAGYCLKDCTTDAECAPLNGYCAQNGGTGSKTCQPGARP